MGTLIFSTDLDGACIHISWFTLTTGQLGVYPYLPFYE